MGCSWAAASGAGWRALADLAGSAGLAQGCPCELPLQAWVGHIVAAARLQLVLSSLRELLCITNKLCKRQPQYAPPHASFSLIFLR